MSQDREQYIKQLEERLEGYEARDKQELCVLRKKDRENRIMYALTGGAFWGAFIPTVGYSSVLQLFGRTTGIETLAITGIGLIAGPTVAFIREKRRQKEEVAQQI